ncbi:MAG: thioredoxin-disulfide reductase [Candidatus Omnitrophica bacterium]|nr:thioredoxin-disulfide reductase [Candidatus Omnitrophota bacterium]MDD5352120.1 thioredoxin-disulfide reductase [Candidatus Omnitrophota bacterium]MDD5549718.1 thioredoxin-disulfide reductase [Candidatus Omnitrophota bacterium]
MKIYDVIIIGAGPAGLTAAIYCGRAKLSTKLIEQSQPGGQVNLTEEVENFPGVFKTSSKNLIDIILKQVNDLDKVEMEEFKEVSDIKYDNNNFEVRGQSLDGKDFSSKSKALIIASGAQPKKLGLKGEEDFTGKGVSYCAVCDAPFFKDKDVVLIGGGDTAIDEALYLAKFARKVKVIHRRDALRASGILQERIKSNPQIELILDSVAVEILGKKTVEKIRVRNVKTNKETEVDCNGVFIFVGYSPNTKFLEGLLELNEEKYIITNEEMATAKKGIFACGDCRKRPFRQIVTACAEGAIAAHSAEQYLSQNNV